MFFLALPFFHFKSHKWLRSRPQLVESCFNIISYEWKRPRNGVQCTYISAHIWFLCWRLVTPEIACFFISQTYSTATSPSTLWGLHLIKPWRSKVLIFHGWRRPKGVAEWCLTPLKFNNSPLKTDHPKRTVVFQASFFRGELLIFFGVYFVIENLFVKQLLCLLQEMIRWSKVANIRSQVYSEFSKERWWK